MRWWWFSQYVCHSFVLYTCLFVTTVGLSSGQWSLRSWFQVNKEDVETGCTPVTNEDMEATKEGDDNDAKSDFVDLIGQCICVSVALCIFGGSTRPSYVPHLYPHLVEASLALARILTMP